MVDESVQSSEPKTYLHTRKPGTSPKVYEEKADYLGLVTSTQNCNKKVFLKNENNTYKLAVGKSVQVDVVKHCDVEKNKLTYSNQQMFHLLLQPQKSVWSHNSTVRLNK